MTGWIKVHRSIREHWLYEEERKFSRFEAWIDILLMVNHKQNKKMIEGELTTINRGQRITSMRKLANKWNWSTSKLNKFLNTLERDGMVKVEKNTKYTMLTVLNYDNYQSEDTQKAHENDAEKTDKKHLENTEETHIKHKSDTEKKQKNIRKKQTRMNKNEKNEKNEKNVVVYDDNEEFKKVVNLYQENIEHIPSPITYQKLTDDFEVYGSDLLMYAIEKSALNNNHNYKFIDYLLKDWRKRGLKNRRAVEQYEQHRNANKFTKNKVLASKELTPKWLMEEQWEVEQYDENLERDKKAFLEQLKAKDIKHQGCL
ncbi:DnaD domain-containing protein [Staphylococcus xylosus]|uniref:DnaD domain-containing protein n=1 Tax=Staphylococcus xylosus TaxID=1288 RepID=UPI001C3EE6F9|nr:DnaD domain protein [Staphylococcus xylosus]